ncbi:DUF547 domain-containing protein [Idiomarina loihiensis]|uniref:DUF547 domain-containing protein n=1 Tax=Idiomarina loihiensis TaxID=135577 RepID=UPI000C121567|nr:MAG: DUF547 domain-containing protein [Leeuwenhoekiella sp.]
MRYLFIILFFISSTVAASNFDHRHTPFTKVLKQHVTVYDNNLKSAVDYTSLAAQPDALNQYLNTLSAVTSAQYQQWNANQQLAFLINAYNGFTLKLIIDNMAEFKSGEATSIRDLGGFFSGPWDQEFFTLLGEKRTLNWLEHDKIRVDFDEPRIHAALVCAAVSCPKLRSEAFTGNNLETQLEDQMATFLSDDDKNGIDADGIYLSKIFDWYGEDFGGLKNYLRNYSKVLADNAAERQRLQSDFSIRYIDYNWQLNSIENR